jgi:uncharacterized membrane protein YkvA (DUF1232 family)
MSKLTDRGFEISKNVLFSMMAKKAKELLGKPFKIGFILKSSYDKLIDVKSEKSGFGQLIDVMFTFIRLVKAYINGSYRNVSTQSLISGIAVLLYVLTPIDLVPDFIPVIGMMDDLSLMAWFINNFQEEINKFTAWESNTDADSSESVVQAS